jgi:cell fate regulator YaaT (PSP1 superfamily)
MITVVGVRFKKAGKIYFFDPNDFEIQRGDDVIVETARGIEFGSAVLGIRDVEDSEIVSPLKKVIRIATEEDKQLQTENQQKAADAFAACVEKIHEHELDMKLVEVEYTFDCNKVIFYFTADGRIDFRELVKDLAAVFRTRIELRQIGVRDEAKIVNGIGPCGVGLCCANWLGDFAPVSIKMAKDQNLSLNPTKISGICGRLMCCLKYEHDTYLEIRRELPNRGERVRTPDGMGIVLDAVILTESVKVRHILGETDGRLELSEDIITYKKDQIGDNPVRHDLEVVEEVDDFVVRPRSDENKPADQPVQPITPIAQALREAAPGKAQRVSVSETAPGAEEETDLATEAPVSEEEAKAGEGSKSRRRRPRRRKKKA